MFSAVKNIFLLCILFFCATVLNAQKNNTSLPSLINNQNENDETNIEALLKQKMYVKVFTSKTKIFVGEPVMATYKFYAALRINDQPTVTKQPEFTGCSVKELNFEQGPEFENINNESYAVYTIRKVQVTPLQQGMLSLGKALVNNFIQVANPADPFVTKKYNIAVTNPDVNIEVNALPEKSKPENFNGITGTFSITAAVSNKKIPVGENGHLIITIKGAGNPDAINKPEINWPVSVDHFDGTDSQYIDQNTFPISGDRIFDIPFIGKKEETVIIPAVKFSFFNTDSKDYQTISTDNITITFTKALAKNSVFRDVINYDTSNRKYLWIVAVIAVFVATISFISYKKNKAQLKKVKAVVSTTPPPVFEQPQPVLSVKFKTDFSKYFDELKTVNEHKAFFAKAKDILIKAVAENVDFNINSEEVLLIKLKQQIGNTAICKKVTALLEAINLHIYAPCQTEASLDFYFNELKQAVEELQSTT